MKKDYSRRHLSTDKYQTDTWIRAMFPDGIWFDPCPIDWNPDTHTDGLTIDWQRKEITHLYQGTFVNPPYSNPLPWVKKAIETYENGGTVVLLLKHDSSTEWYRLLHEAGAKLLMINRRLKYGTNRGAAFPSLLAVLA